MGNDIRENLAWLLNTLDFINSSKKTEKEEIDQYAYSLDETLTEIFKPFCDHKENRNAVSQRKKG